jgi:formylglycine-generating enzyme required for sulfatase activity
MGSPTGEAGRDDDETQHHVTLTRDFYIQATEVTQGQWQDVMGTTPSYFSNCGRECPVERVSWWDAVAYVNTLSKREGLEVCYDRAGCTGRAGGGCKSGEGWCEGDYSCREVRFKGLGCRGYRLPTEAEWEYAARAKTTGSRYGDLDAVAWHLGNSGRTTHRVGQKRANAWGLYDMLGNVWEWSHDWYGAYPGGPAVDPVGAGAGSARVVRGGSWLHDARYVRAAARGRGTPGSRSRNIGLRPTRSVF